MDNTKKRAIALGFFDGVHLGHQALLRKTMEEARARDMAPAVFTFDRSPKEFVTGVPVPLITTVAERRRVVERLFPGMEMIVAPFDEEMRDTPWEDFLLMLTRELRGGFLVAGHDFHFGAKNAGTPQLLMERSAQLGLGCAIVPAVLMDGQVVSSTRIRRLLEAGEAQAAGQLLGRPFAMEGHAAPDSGAGSPDVCILPAEGQLMPACGAYASYIERDGRRLPSVTYVRDAGDGSAFSAESRLLDSTIRLPQGECRVELLSALSRDMEEAKAYFSQQNEI